MTPEQVFETYRALKCHFTSDSYDYIKYKGHMKPMKKPIREHMHFRYAYVLQKKYDYNCFYLFLANLVQDSGIILPKMVATEADEVYNEWRRRTERMKYTFEQDLRLLREEESVFVKLFEETDDSDLPPILYSLYNKDVCIETLSIIDRLLPLRKKWESLDHPIWDRVISKKLDRYNPFLDVEKAPYIRIIKEIYGN